MANISKRKVLVIAGVVACVFACAIVALLEFDSLGRPTPSGPSKGPSATAGYMIALGPLSAAWGFSMYIRCSDAKIRRWLVGVAALVAFWMLVVLLKYPIRGDLATALLWYCYYIPMTAIPTLCVLCAMRAASLDEVAWARCARRVIVAISAFAVFAVLTNNVHHFIFAFDFADPDWGGNYRYAFGHYVLVAWYIVLFVIFFATLFLSARRSLRSMLFPIGVIVGVGVVYGVMFTLRHVATLTSNVALTYCILAMVAIELTLDLGFFPSYAWYTLAFSKLPFDLKVLEANGDTVFQTEMAQPMPQAAADTLKTADKGLGESWAFRTTGAPHTLFKVYPVTFCIDLAECFASDGSNAGCFLHIDSLQFAAACKCIFLNLLHIASDRNFLQLLTALECIFADPCYFVDNAVDLNGFGNVYRSHFLICCNNCCCLLLCVQDLISDLIQNSLVHSRFFRLTWFLCRSLGRFFRWFFCWFFRWLFGRFFRFRFCFLQFCFCIL